MRDDLQSECSRCRHYLRDKTVEGRLLQQTDALTERHRNGDPEYDLACLSAIVGLLCVSFCVVLIRP